MGHRSSPWLPASPRISPALGDEDIGVAICILRHQVVGSGDKGNEAPIGTDRRGVAPGAARGTAKGDAHQFSIAGLPIPPEDIRVAVGIFWHQLVSLRSKGDEAAV